MAAPSGAIPCEKPWQCSLLMQSFQRPLKIPQVQIPAGAVEGKVQAVEGQQIWVQSWRWEARGSSSQVAHCHLAGICLFSLQTKFPWHCAA